MTLRPEAGLRPLIVAAAAVLSLGATVAVAKPPQPAPLEEGSGDALVYVYRAARLDMGALGAVLWIDGVQSNKLGNGACTVLRLPAGSHQVQISWLNLLGQPDTRAGPVRAPADLEPGKSYWFRFETRDGPDQGGYGTIEWELFPVDEARGVKDMKSCHAVPPAAAYTAVRQP